MIHMVEFKLPVSHILIQGLRILCWTSATFSKCQIPEVIVVNIWIKNLNDIG